MTLTLWLCFLAAIAGLIALDLGVLSRRPRAVTPLEALASVALWILGAAGAALAIFHIYENDFGGLEQALSAPLPALSAERNLDGHSALLQFAAGYVLETILSLDNLAVMALIFAYFRIPAHLLSRALFWTILLALIVRLLMVLGGAWLLRNVAFAHYVMAGLLAVATVRTLLLPDAETDFSRTWIVRLVRRVLPTSLGDDGQRLLTRRGSRLAATPLAMAVIVASLTDITFAADSIPAVFAVTHDPFLAFSSNALALLGLRSIFFAIQGVMGHLRYLKITLTLVLLVVAGKMLVFDYSPPWSIAALIAVGGLGLAGIGASLAYLRFSSPGAVVLRPAPIADVVEAVAITRRNLRKILILIAGTVVVLAGLAVGPLPGPGGIVVVGAGLGLLATEFIWARRLLLNLKVQSEVLAKHTDRVAARVSVWTVPALIVAYVAFFAGCLYLSVIWVTPALEKFVLATATGGLFPLTVYCFRAVRVWLRQKGWMAAPTLPATPGAPDPAPLATPNSPTPPTHPVNPMHPATASPIGPDRSGSAARQAPPAAAGPA